MPRDGGVGLVGGGLGHSIFHPPQPGQLSFPSSSLGLETLAALPGYPFPQGLALLPAPALWWAPAEAGTETQQ